MPILGAHEIEAAQSNEQPNPGLSKTSPDPRVEEALDLTRVTRSRRKREVRARTISIKRMTKRELLIGSILYPERDYPKPRTRADCENAPRPCPYVSCAHHLYADVSPTTGAIKLNFPDLEPEELSESCALDVADRGGTTLEDVGAIMNVTRERIRQVEARALAKAMIVPVLAELAADARTAGGKRRLPVVS